MLGNSVERGWLKAEQLHTMIILRFISMIRVGETGSRLQDPYLSYITNPHRKFLSSLVSDLASRLV